VYGSAGRPQVPAEVLARPASGADLFSPVAGRPCRGAPDPGRPRINPAEALLQSLPLRLPPQLGGGDRRHPSWAGRCRLRPCCAHAPSQFRACPQSQRPGRGSEHHQRALAPLGLADHQHPQPAARRRARSAARISLSAAVASAASLSRDISSASGRSGARMRPPTMSGRDRWRQCRDLEAGPSASASIPG
jgi:hypothetical protein